MSLNTAKQEAVNEMITLMTEMRTRTDNADEEFANRFFGIMLKWLLKADLKYITGLVAGSNPVTGTLEGKLE